MFYREGLTLSVVKSQADCLEAVKQANDNCFWWIKWAVSHNCYRTRSLFATRSITIWLFIHPSTFAYSSLGHGGNSSFSNLLFTANKVFSTLLRDQCKKQKPDPEKVQTFHHSVTLIKWRSFPFSYIFWTELVRKGSLGGNQHNWEWPVAIYPYYIPHPKIPHTLKTPQHTHIHAQGDKQFIRHSG